MQAATAKELYWSGRRFSPSDRTIASCSEIRLRSCTALRPSSWPCSVCLRLSAPSLAPGLRQRWRRYAREQVLVDPSFQHQPAISPQHWSRGLGPGWAALLLICTTLMCLASAATAFIVLLRPLLRNMDKASRATEKAAEELGQASREIERAALKFQTDMDKTLPEVAAASKEFQELGRSFNALGSGITDNIVVRPVRVVQGATSSSLRRVVQDVGQLTSALTPAVDDWRRRITSLASRFERLKGQSPQELPALAEAQQNIVAADHHVSAAEEVNQQVSTWTARHAEENESSVAASQQLQSVQSAAAQASDALQKVTADSAGLLRQLDEGGAESDDAATAAAQEGARLINDAAAAAERMAREARSMTIAIDGVPDTPAIVEQSTISAPSDAPESTASLPVSAAAPAAISAAAAAAAPAVAATGVSTAEDSRAGSTDTGHATRRRRKTTTKTRALATSSLSDAEIELLEQLKDRKDAAQAVYMALERAEQAATAAAEASTTLEEALQRAERRSSMDEGDGDGLPGAVATSMDAQDMQDGMAAQLIAQ